MILVKKPIFAPLARLFCTLLFLGSVLSTLAYASQSAAMDPPIPANYAGFFLLLLGIIFMILEALVFSFGALGVGGVIAFIAGSVLLLDTNILGYRITWPVIIMMGLFSAVFCVVVINLALRSLRKKIVTGREALVGEEGHVLEYDADEIMVKIQGEIWKASAESPLKIGQRVRVIRVSGLLLSVEPSDTKDGD